jgi:hypothetical protein
MTFLGLSLLAWTALAAIAGFTLAAVTIIAVLVTIRLAHAERKRDDRKRQEDRDWDAAQRREDRERSDRLRAEDAANWERRAQAEQRDREDYEARQVTVEVSEERPPFESAGHDLDHRVAVSTPAAYPIKWVDAQVVHWTNGTMGIRSLGHGGDEPSLENGRVYYRFWAEMPSLLHQPAVIAKFVDRHGNLYYTYRGHTRRFPQDTDWPAAAAELSYWARLGPGLGPDGAVVTPPPG